MIRILAIAARVALPASAAAQEGTLDVLDGETLYENGWLFTIGYEHESREGLRSGSSRVSDPLNRELTDETAALGAHYGLRYNIQLSVLVPHVTRTLEAGSEEFQSSGLGDTVLVAKWRYYRWDDTGKALNCAILAGLETPTGEDDAEDNGVRLPAELQPGSGSWDPALGTAVTYEPGRWRFNAALLYQRNGKGAEDYKFGDETFGEIAIGNRFWLEPYPGPFMRFDALIRYRHQARATQAGGLVHDSGSEVVTAGATLAFRPQPTIDLQLFLEYPIHQDVDGTQLEEDLSIFFAFGLRL